MSKTLAFQTVNVNGTSLRGYLDNTPWPFEELVARLLTLSGQNAMDSGDGYKVSVEFEGSFDGIAFTLYDYKGGGAVHIGGHDRLDVPSLKAALLDALKDVTPTPYTAVIHYDEQDGLTHSFGRLASKP